jgi:hypothetical protein
MKNLPGRVCVETVWKSTKSELEKIMVSDVNSLGEIFSTNHCLYRDVFDARNRLGGDRAVDTLGQR